MNQLFTIILSVLMGSVGQVVLKMGANKLGELTLSIPSIFLELFRIIKIPEIILGLILFGTSFLLWIKVLTTTELSYAYPMVSLGYINVIILSYFIFDETLTVMKIIGMILIILGILFLNR